MAAKGCEMHIVCRNPGRGEAAVVEIMKVAEQKVFMHICDLANVEHVKRFASEWLAKGTLIHSLLNCAGFVPVPDILH